MSGFLDNLADHDARHNICAICPIVDNDFITIVKIDGAWKHNRKGYAADHDPIPASRIFGGCRELLPHEEIYSDPFPGRRA
jgi:hypothetical protein